MHPTCLAPTPAAPAARPTLTVFYDHACPICRAEMLRLAGWDRHGRLALVDCSAPQFNAADFGFTDAALDRELHGVTADGQVLRGLACLRRAYALTRYGWLWRITAWPLLRPGFDRFYLWFARNRRAISRYTQFGRGPGDADNAPGLERRDDACGAACASKLTGT